MPHARGPLDGTAHGRGQGAVQGGGAAQPGESAIHWLKAEPLQEQGGGTALAGLWACVPGRRGESGARPWPAAAGTGSRATTRKLEDGSVNATLHTLVVRWGG